MRVDGRLPVPHDKNREYERPALDLAGFVETPTAERGAGSNTVNFAVADPIVALKSVEASHEPDFEDSWIAMSRAAAGLARLHRRTEDE
jgi:hypothetical protein